MKEDIEKMKKDILKGLRDEGTTNHIVIEIKDEEQAYKLFEEIQNKYNLYDNCVIETNVPMEDTIIDEDRKEETGGYEV